MAMLNNQRVTKKNNSSMVSWYPNATQVMGGWWMFIQFIPPKMVIIGVDPSPNKSTHAGFTQNSSQVHGYS